MAVGRDWQRRRREILGKDTAEEGLRLGRVQVSALLLGVCMCACMQRWACV